MRLSSTDGRPPLQGPGSAGLNFFPINGQSLALGQAYPALSNTPSTVHKMFSGGLRPRYDCWSAPTSPFGWYNGLAALVENNCADPVWTGLLGETPASGAAQMVTQLIAAENGAPAAAAYSFLMSCPGEGAAAIAGLSKGTAPYARLLQQTEWAKAQATFAGYSFAAQAMAWIQGENDYSGRTTRATYATALEALAANWATDGAILARQSFAPVVFCSQIASHNYPGLTVPTVALAQFDAMVASTGIDVVAPMYQYEYPAGDWHLSNTCSKWLGAYLGIAYKRRVHDGLARWHGLKPATCTRSVNTISLTFNVGNDSTATGLVFDTTWTYALSDGNYGFQAYQSDHSTALTISSVNISGGNTVNIVCSGAVPANAWVNYAWAADTVSSSPPGRSLGARGNLRDSQGVSIVFDPSGINQPMHNWCLMFEAQVTN